MAQSTKVPTNPIGLYYTWWNPGGALDSFSQTFNIIIMFHATGGSPVSTNGQVFWNQPVGFTQAQTIAQINTIRARGQLLVLSCGGGNAGVQIDTPTKRDNFVNSVININTQLGGSQGTPMLDGIDMNNFEQLANVAQRQYQAEAAVAIKQYFGSDFLITAPPASSTWNGSNPNINQGYEDRQLLQAMYYGDGTTQALDLLMPQYYDNLSLVTESNLRTWTDFYHQADTIWNGQTVQIPRDHIGIAFAIDPTGSNSGRWLPQAAANGYTAMVNEGKKPKGAYYFSSDPGQEGHTTEFINTIAPVVNNNVGGGGDTTPPTVSQSTYSGGETVSGIVSISATASDNDVVEYVALYVNNVIVSVDSVSPYNLLWNTGSLPDGTYSVFVRAYDPSGNFADTPTINLTIDNSPPTNDVTHLDRIPASVFSHIDGNPIGDVSHADTFPIVKPVSVAFLEDVQAGLPGSFASINQATGGTATVDGTSKVMGTNSIAFGATATGGTAYARYNYSTDVNETYIQFKGFIPTAYDIDTTDTANYQGLLQLLSMTDAQQIRFNIESNALDISVAGSDFAPGYTNTGVSLPRNQVFTLEIYVKKNDIAGQVKIWLNNTNEGAPDYDSGLVNTAFFATSKLNFGYSYVPVPAADNIYLDNFAIDAAFIGNRV